MNSKETNNTSISKGKNVSTVLSHRYYLQICVLSLITFLILHLLLGYNRISDYPFCPYQPKYAAWTRDWNLLIGGGLFISLCLQCNRFFLSNFRQENTLGTLSTYYATLCVNFICTFNHFSMLFMDWGGTCRDIFGVEFPAALWLEWIVTVPLLVFITVSLHDKPYLSRDDIFVIVGQFLSMVVGFLAIFSPTIYLSGILVGVGIFLGIPFYIFALRSQNELEELISKGKENLAKKGLSERKVLLASRKATLAGYLALILPIIPMIYFFRLNRILDADFTYAAFNFSSAFTIIFFASICMDAHLEVSHPVIALIDAEKFAHTTRRAFLRYVFHEIRVPLNSISLGLQILGSNSDANDHETLGLMKDAVNFMGETLNDVMTLQTVEEGSLELIWKPFSVKNLFENIEDSFVEIATEMEVKLKTILDPTIPPVLIGDKYRLRHVIANLVSNAIKHSLIEKEVVIKATIDKISSSNLPLEPVQPNGKFVMVVFSVENEGKGISQEDQDDDIFQPYRALKYGELKEGRGTGIGLAICKEIVHMHGGEISYRSEVGRGTTFHVYIPLEVCEAEDIIAWNASHRFKGTMQGKGIIDSHYNVLHPSSSSSIVHQSGTRRLIEVQEDQDHAIELSPAISGRLPSFSQWSNSKSKSKSIDDTALSSSPEVINSTTGLTPDDPVSSSNPAATKPRSGRKELSEFRVLVVDDVESNRKFLRQILKIRGLTTIDMAEDGMIAVDKIEIAMKKNQSYDVIFMDNTMPNMTGIAACLKLRSIGFKNLIIGVTANCMEDELDDFRKSGADLVITKPMKANLLELLISLMKVTGSESYPNKRLIYRENKISWEEEISVSSSYLGKTNKEEK